ncbi:DUF4112 domain-containing protein [Pyxidicoccus xibeiensis]|uniref:DUF4112 domain-containing protein n=1 Tax=Pyxidicoccus xibeiensis TaxID=2906759 RepID=UPI0020A7FF04|nr:DUF4112 domain-containing protein [Pyxidicoccus xibeiensis]MCP3140828.1 DUF4112 domain-containing protein [Pyxidicoccus xibeiensis]
MPPSPPIPRTTPPPALATRDAKSLEQLRWLSHTLDASIPLPFGVRVGWDAVLGLIPGVGDAAGGLMSAYVVLQAARLGAPPAVLGRMLGNVGIEVLVGAVPLVGDLFDAGFKANLRNVRLLEQHLDSPHQTRRASTLWVVGVLLALVLMVGAGIALTFAFLVAFGGFFTGGGS